MKRFLSLWDMIGSIGANHTNEGDQLLLRYINHCSFMSLLVMCATSSWYYFFWEWTLAYLLVNISGIVLYGLVLVLQSMGQIRYSRLVLTLVVPLIYLVSTLLFGGFMAQGLASGATIAIAFLLYRHYLAARRIVISYNIALFVLVTLYGSVSGPVLGYYDMVLDEVVAYCLSIYWVSATYSVIEEQHHQIIQDLERTNLALQQKTNQLERFNYIASHDLKSPLRNIISFLDLIELRLKHKKYEALPEYIGFAKGAARQMHYLVSGILELSTLEKHLKQEPEWVDLNEIFSTACRMLAPEIEDKTAYVNCDPLPFYFGNPQELLLLFQNLIQNGIKYNVDIQPTVTVKGDTDQKNLTLTFTDNGIGFEDTYKEQIFEFFTRLHTQEEFAGTGIGLGICKQIVMRNGGEIRTSSSPGQGSVFIISMPITKEQATEQPNNSRMVLL